MTMTMTMTMNTLYDIIRWSTIALAVGVLTLVYLSVFRSEYWRGLGKRADALTALILVWGTAYYTVSAIQESGALRVYHVVFGLLLGYVAFAKLLKLLKLVDADRWMPHHRVGRKAKDRIERHEHANIARHITGLEKRRAELEAQYGPVPTPGNDNNDNKDDTDDTDDKDATR